MQNKQSSPRWAHTEMSSGTAGRDACRKGLSLCSHSVASESLWPHGLQHARLLCPSLSPGVCSNSCPLSYWLTYIPNFPGGPVVKNLPAMWETWVRSLGGKIPWRRAWKPTLVFLPGESPWTEEPGRLQNMGSKESDMTEWLSTASNYNIQI